MLAVALVSAGGVLYAQLEGADRGVPPIDSASTLEVTGVQVDVSAKTGEEARYEGWRQAQGLGWKALWAKTTGRPRSEAPNLPDSVLNSIVSGIIIEEEQIGPKRYIARLGLLFDRARTGQMLGGGQGIARRSAPMLVIPVLQSGSSLYSFEFRNEWQKAWARFRTGGSAIDYVRPVGSGIDPLLLNVAQARRPGRGWWRLLLDQYGAADVVVPEVHLKRLYPGGPVIGTFSARFGPDDRLLDRFTLRVENSASLPRLLDEGVRRLDLAYTEALNAGLLRPDPSLVIEEPALVEEIAEQIEAATTATNAAAPSGPVPVGAAAMFSIQVDTPNAGAVSQAELSVSRIPGVTSALTTSLALGGTSVMRVTFVGDSAALATALQGQGWSVTGSGNTLRISRPGASPPSGE
ncbi:heavy-metal-associated domain-containing protein [Sphingosinicella sp. LY1275]|uniref:heavy-metal-associated domain-containing protein n=1 Tax=Sphingosinicella sp. LY1275 TaxID=3095379 RepID=UPI002ADEDA4B|nr:heavy-metal-associated domain-containing protein [Sphingosinicella sp. LY1275]MEA1013397.1 heavy-metal-associated domain-containing protein [Sphingosinicella sp. LY1275]